MDAIEKAIRTAFDKGDPSNRAFREKVYRSAFAALDKALQANPNVTQAIADRRRLALSERISQIETEFIPAVGPAEPAGEAAAAPEVSLEREGRAPASPAPEAPRVQASRAEPRFEPTVSSQDRAGYEAQGGPAYAGRIEPPDYAGGTYRRRRGRNWLIGLVALLVVAAGLWWAIGAFFRPATQGGPALPSQEQEPAPGAGTDVNQPPRGVGSAPDLAGWIAVFEPSDPTTVTAPGDSTAEVVDEDGQQLIRIRSGASGSPVLFDVGQGVLEQLAGRRAVFNVVASAGDATQFSVDCNLGELGDCGRKRYAAGVTREEFLFEMNLPNVNPGSGGTIAINPDIENTGKTLDIYEIRVSPAS